MSDKQTPEVMKQLFQGLHRYHLLDKVAMLKALEEKYGEEIFEVVDKARGELTKNGWGQVASKSPSTTIDDLEKALWQTRFDLFDYTREDIGDNTVQMHVSRCFFADLARELGVERYAYHLFCVDDPFIVEGFNPEIVFSRTKTLMEGDEECDHCYSLRRED